MARQVQGPHIASTWTLNEQEFVDSLNRGEAAARRTGSAVERQTQRMERGFRGVGRSVRNLLGLFAGVQAARLFSREAIGGAAEFETLLEKIGTLGETQRSSLQGFRQDVLDIGRATGETFPVLLKALFDINSAGIEAAKSTQFLSDSTALAVAGFTDVSTALQGTLGVLKAYELDAGKAAQVSDILFVAMQKGRTDIQQLSTAMAPVLPIAAQMGLSFQEVASAISALTLVTGNTNTAVTQLRSLLVGVAKNTDDASLSAERLREVGLDQFLNELAEATDLNITKLQQLFGRVEAVSGASTLAADGAKNYKEILDAVSRSSGVVAQNAQRVNQTFSRQASIAKRELQATLIGLGDSALPKLSRAIRNASRAFSEFVEDNKEEIDDLLTSIVEGAIRFGTQFAAVLAAITPALDVFLSVLAVRIAFVTSRFAFLLFGLGEFGKFLTEVGAGGAAVLRDLGIVSEENAQSFIDSAVGLRRMGVNIRDAAGDMLKFNAETILSLGSNLDMAGAAEKTKQELEGVKNNMAETAEDGKKAADATDELRLAAKGANDETEKRKPLDEDTLSFIRDATRELSDQIALLKEADPLQRERLRIIQETTNAINEIDFRKIELPESARNQLVELLRELEKLRLDDLDRNAQEDGETYGGRFGEAMSSTVKGSLQEALRTGFEDPGDLLQGLADGVFDAVTGALVDALVGDSVRNAASQIFNAVLSAIGINANVPAPTRQFGGVALSRGFYELAEVEPERVLREREFQALRSEIAASRMNVGGGGGRTVIELEPSSVVERGYEQSLRMVRAVQDLSTQPATSLMQLRNRRRNARR